MDKERFAFLTRISNDLSRKDLEILGELLSIQERAISSPSPQNPDGLYPTEIDLCTNTHYLRQNNLEVGANYINAIKHYCTRTGKSLLESKQACDTWMTLNFPNT